MELDEADRQVLEQRIRLARDMTHQPFSGVSRQELLDAFALSLSPVPFAGTGMGLAADANKYATDPKSRTLGNYGWTAASLAPFGKIAEKAANAVKEGRKVVWRGRHAPTAAAAALPEAEFSPKFYSSDPALAALYATTDLFGGFSPASALDAFVIPKNSRILQLKPKIWEEDGLGGALWDDLHFTAADLKRAGIDTTKPRVIPGYTTNDLSAALKKNPKFDAFEVKQVHDMLGDPERIAELANDAQHGSDQFLVDHLRELRYLPDSMRQRFEDLYGTASDVHISKIPMEQIK